MLAINETVICAIVATKSCLRIHIIMIHLVCNGFLVVSSLGIGTEQLASFEGVVSQGTLVPMPRKLSINELLVAACTPDPKCVQYLHDELKLLEPNEEVVRRLVEFDPSRATTANESGSIALHIACGNIENLTIEILSCLIQCAQDALLTPNIYGMLPIHKAVGAFCTKKSLPNIKFVAESNLESLTCRTKDGQIPLHFAFVAPKLYTITLVSLLLHLQPKALRLADKYGHYPLHKAASKSKIDPGVVGLLTEYAPEVASQKDANGWLPLHWALSRDRPHTEILFLLVSAYPEGLFDPDYQDQLPYDKLIQRSKVEGDICSEILALMEFTRQQIHSRTAKPVRVASPNIRFIA